AILTVEELNKRGINARLIMVGIKKVPDAYKGIPYVDYVGFLDKNDRQQYERYIETVKSTHIFLLPTQAECAGIVFAEASAFGIPIFTYDTGGIPNYVINGVNGYRLPMSSSYVAFADKIIKAIQADELLVLGKGGMQLYKDKLNWHTWAQSFRKIMDKTFACK
ncbi:MAG: glycosyltransferase family 4 protein, partial [Bacteroidetes bacterium]|nr:glycosyltransferase family 4 protein [Candidatus Gallipaludibacter merdavium]